MRAEILVSEAARQFNGRVHIIIPAAPWQCVLAARSASLSATKLACQLSPSTFGPELEDLRQIFQEGETYHLQLEDLGTPGLVVNLHGRLLLRELSAAGSQLNFALPPDQEIDLWLHSQSAGGQRQ